MIVISYGLTGNAVFSMLIAFMNFNTFILAQDTMYDLKIGQMVSASPKKQIKAQFIGIFFGCLAGTALFYAIIKVFGLNDELFTFPFGNMYYAVINGISEGGVSTLFNPGRFAIGGALGGSAFSDRLAGRRYRSCHVSGAEDHSGYCPGRHDPSGGGKDKRQRFCGEDG